jgi:hypothetical protein
MADDPLNSKTDGILALGAAGPVAVPPPPPQKVAEALNKVVDPEAKVTLAVALSRTSYGFGPDPETAKIIADGEMHEENCRLEGYKASLDNRDKQNERDHDFRKRRLNRETAMALSVLAVRDCWRWNRPLPNYQRQYDDWKQSSNCEHRNRLLRPQRQSRNPQGIEPF